MIRKAFLKRVESSLDILDADIDRIVAKANRAEQDAKIRYEDEIAVLRMKQEAVRAKIQRVREAGDASWGGLKGGVLEATDDLKSAIEKAIERLRKSA